MTTSRPPRLADWLLRRLASGPKKPSLIGDLHEQFRGGRSAAWYWRQTFRVIGGSAAWDIRRHPVLAVRTLALTYLFLAPWVYFTGNIYAFTKWWMVDHVLRRSIVLHDLWVLDQIPLLTAWCFGWALTGWVLAKLQPDCRAGMALVAVSAQVPWAVLYGAPIWRLANAGLPFFSSFPVVTGVVFVMIGLPASLVVGSLLAEPQLSARVPD